MAKNLDDIGFVPDDVGFIPDEQEVIPVEEGSNLEDLARGAASGATFGFADELTGAGRAALDIAQGKSDLENLMDTYRKYQKESEQAYEASKERSPYLYGSGQVLGGLGSAVASAPLLAVKGVGLGARAAGMVEPTLAKAAAKIAPEGANILQRGAGALIGKVAPKAVGGATEGALFGGIMGAGESKSGEGNLQKDILSGVESGATFGGVLGGATVPIKGAVNMLKAEDNAAFRQMISKPFEWGYKGDKFDFMGDKAYQEVGAELGRTEPIVLKETVGDLLGKTKEIFKSFMNEADQSGETFKLQDLGTDEVLEALYNIEKHRPAYLEKSPILNDIMDTIVRGEELKPTQLQDMKMIFRDVGNTWERALSDDTGALRDAAQPLKNIASRADKLLAEKFDQYKTINELYSKPRHALGVESYDYSPEKQKALDSILDDIYMNSESPTGAFEAPRAKNDFFKGLEAMRQDPEYGNAIDEVLYKGLDKLDSSGANRLGIKDPVQAFKQHIKDTSDKYQVASGGRGLQARSGGFESGKHALLSGSTLVRRTTQHAAHGAGELLKAGVDTARLFNLPVYSLEKIATKLQSTKFKHYGDALLKASQDSGTQSKNAILFSILQNPEARQLIESTEE